MRFDIITIFPKIFDSYLHESIVGRAAFRGIVEFHAHDLRDFSKLKHRKVDDRPYGGGAGMVLMAEPVLKAVDAIRTKTKRFKRRKVIILSAKGKQFDQKMAYAWAKNFDEIIFISGRYEGIDERAKTALRAEEISIGPYVLTDGEVASMVIISAVARLLPGAIRLESLEEESHWKGLVKKETKGASNLEYPHYTRPEVLSYKGKKYRVPRVLLGGDHEKIRSWRSQR